MNEMEDMRTNNRGYNNRYYDENIHGYRENYRDDYRDDYRDSYTDNYRDDYRRGYDRRGGRINNRNYRNYRNYREQDYYEELQMSMEDIREQSRRLEDISEMAHNQQDKNMIMKVAEKEKENYNYLKQIANKQM